MNTVASFLRTAVLSEPDVIRLTSLKRSAVLFSQGQVADALYLVDDGLIKLTRSNAGGGRFILTICGPDHLLGEEALAEGRRYHVEAEALSPANVYRISRDTLKRAVAHHPELAGSLINYLSESKLGLAHKIELLCLHDVEYRILFYLAELAKLVKQSENGGGHQLPITQLELADLIGATRETTSTTLNQLERRGLVRLSRRLLTIISPETLRAAAESKLASAATPGN